ncbi:uncharacterized protein LOC143753755 [Siphateles boraxobius]|uniref:uncharacterized protein LOC143753755 n=1 Tax=Siphateles boraxobius TaxID=180520 RepID=UPI004064C4DA
MVLSCLITVLIILPLKHLEAVQLKEVNLGDTVVLKCNISFYNDIHWLKISEGRPVALMVTSLKHNGELSVVWNYNESRFEGFMEEQLTGLRISQISTSDLSTYHCATLYQKHLDFDKGVQLYTNQQSKEKPFDRVKDLSGGLNGLSLHYQVFAAALCSGLLGMLLAVSVVHMKTRTKKHLQH